MFLGGPAAIRRKERGIEQVEVGMEMAADCRGLSSLLRAVHRTSSIWFLNAESKPCSTILA